VGFRLILIVGEAVAVPGHDVTRSNINHLAKMRQIQSLRRLGPVGRRRRPGISVIASDHPFPNVDLDHLHREFR